MKTKTRHIFLKISGLLILFLLVIVFFLTACQKEPGPPVIHNIRLTDPSTAGMSLPGANLEAWIVIQGENFTDLKKVIINGLEVFVNTAYVTDNNIVVQIPAETPNMGTSPEIEGYVEVITSYGSVSYRFDIFAPAPITSLISNEFANPGDTLTLYGKYFFYVQSVSFPGNIQAQIISSADDGSSCTVIVPDSALLSGPLSVTTVGGTRESNGGVHYQDTSGMICDFDSKNLWEGWGGQVVDPASDPVLPSFMGQAFKATAANITTEAWWVQEFAMPIMSGLYPRFSNTTSASQIAVKFEVFAKGPWNSGYYNFQLVRRDSIEKNGEMVFDWVDVYNYYYQPWGTYEDRKDFETSYWQTAILPLDQFFLVKENGVDVSGDKRYISTFSDIRNFNFLGCYFVNPTKGLAVPLNNLTIGIDNIRLVQNVSK